MNMFGLFTEKAPNRVFFAIILGMISGFGLTLIIPMVLKVLGQNADAFMTVDSSSVYIFNWQVSDYKFAAMFVLMVMVILLARTIGQFILIKIAVTVAQDIRVRIYRRLINSSLVDIDNIGQARIMAVLTADVPRVVNGARLLPELITTSTTLIGMMGYLAYLNTDVFWFVIGCIVFGIVSHQIPTYFGRNYLRQSREHMDTLHESIRGLIYGVKELKLDENKREDYFARMLLADEENLKEAHKTGQRILQFGVNWGNVLSFFIIGAVSFVVANHVAMSKAELIGVVMVLLYITGPVQMILNFTPQYIYAKVSLKKIDQMFEMLKPEGFTGPGTVTPSWQTIRFENVTYQHSNKFHDRGFCIGPANFEIRKGEVTFIVGGNGSGKSTLSKLVSLHYPRLDGNIYFDDNVVDSHSITAFRNDIAVIYSDYYLFTRLLGLDHEQQADKVSHYLKMLGLEEKVDFVDGEFSTLSLSDGQRRRLALLVSFIENKELYIFDEWAADQDPKFKRVFYEEILPSLKAKNKAIVVISHDDRYFSCADHTIQLEDGQIIRDQNGPIAADFKATAADGKAADIELHM